MKKILFTLMMIAVLVISTSVAMAQTAVTPYIGSTHDYSLPISVSGNATVSVFLSGTESLTQDLVTTDNWTPSNGVIVDPTNGNGTFNALVGTAEYTATINSAPTDVTGITFDITYGSSLSTSTTYYLIVEVTGPSCNNWIALQIAPTAAPSLTLAMGADPSDVCMTLGSGDLTDNVDALSQGTTSITYTTTPTTTATGYTYDYVLTISGHSILTGADAPVVSSGTATISVSGQVITVSDAAAGLVSITVKIASVEGAQPDLVATLSASPTMTLSEAEGSNTITGSNSDATTAVGFSTSPTIGIFTF